MIPSWLPDTVTTDAARMVHLALLWGIEAIELRLVGLSRVPHVNEVLLRARLLEAEMEIASVVPGLFEGAGEDRASSLNDLSQLDETLSFCKRVGCSTIVVSGLSSPSAQLVDILRQAGDRAGRQGQRIALLNEPEMAIDTMAEAAKVVLQAEHPAVLAALQPSPGTPLSPADEEALLALEGHIALVRCDFGAPRGLERDAFVPALVLIHRAGFAGPVSALMPPGLQRGAGLAHATSLITQIRKAKA